MAGSEEAVLEEATAEAKHGVLSAARAASLVGDEEARHRFCSSISWALFTTEWMDSVGAFLIERGLEGARVVEVCAGNGCLTSAMRATGFDWIASDVRPTIHSNDPDLKSIGALSAVVELRPDCIFWAWWPKLAVADAQWRTSRSVSPPEDYRLAEMCWRRGIPMLFVGEPPGGVTGSVAFWQGPWTVRAVSTAPSCELPCGRRCGCYAACDCHAEPVEESDGSGSESDHASVCPRSSQMGSGARECEPPGEASLTLRPFQRMVPSAACDMFRDVPQWRGYFDRTWFIEAQEDS